MSTSTEVARHNSDGRKSVMLDMAHRFGMEPKAFEQTLRATVVPQNITNEQFAAFLMVAKKYNLDPVTKQIYAFPNQNGGIQPIVSIDGWMNLINSHPQFDGMEFQDELDESGKIVAITCRMYRKDRNHPTSVTEYMSECERPTPTWKKWPARMLRHKAAIQAARYTFGFSGIMDEDEAARMIDVTQVERPAPTTGNPARPGRMSSIIEQHRGDAGDGEPATTDKGADPQEREGAEDAASRQQDTTQAEEQPNERF